MKIAVIYMSQHHGNTKKLLDAIAQDNTGDTELTLIDAAHPKQTDLSGYDLIGFASGIYYQKFHEAVLQFAKEHLPQRKKVFLIHTCGVKRDSYTEEMKTVCQSKEAQLMGSYQCPGYDTFGPFKLVGGIAKGRPNNEDIAGAVQFYKQVCEKAYEKG